MPAALRKLELTIKNLLPSFYAVGQWQTEHRSERRTNASFGQAGYNFIRQMNSKEDLDEIISLIYSESEVASDINY
jgi:hypothetical protein